MWDILIFEENSAICRYFQNNFDNIRLNRDAKEYDLAVVNTDVELFPFEIKTKCLLLSENIAMESVPIWAKQIISCGMSSRSTVCFSSIDEYKAFLCVQRQLECLCGKTVFPCDIPCKYNPKMSVNENIICNAARLYLHKDD